MARKCIRLTLSNPTALTEQNTTAMKKCSDRRKHCVLAVVRRSQNFSPHCRPLPRGTGRPKFNQLEMVTTFTYKPSLVRIDACNFELSWYQTHPHTNTYTHPQTGLITIHCAAASTQCNYSPKYTIHQQKEQSRSSKA